MTLAIVLSGTYVSQDIQSEFGRLPPSFLPMGGKRLFQHQCSALQGYFDSVVISIPNDFVVPQVDRKSLEKLGAKTQAIDPSLTLRESLIELLSALANKDERIIILYGDTLIPQIDSLSPNFIGVSSPSVPYEWGSLETSTNRGDEVLCGILGFSSPRDFLRCLRESEGLLESIALYKTQIEMEVLNFPEWLDFGTLQSFYLSKTWESTHRQFNDVSISNGVVAKTSQDLSKVASEACWYESLPPSLRIFTPAFLGRVQNGYRMEYLPSPTLQELSVFGDTDRKIWEKIARSCLEFVTSCEIPDKREQAINARRTLSREKTLSRVSNYLQNIGLKIGESLTINGEEMPSVLEAISISQQLIDRAPVLPGVMHGDFCFSNIVYDFRTSRIKTFDPRGCAEIDGAIYGDRLYDLGKLMHSLMGYDTIVCDRFSVSRRGRLDIQFGVEISLGQSQITQSFERELFSSLSPTTQDITAMAVQQLLALIPLHSDAPSRQLGFLSLALQGAAKTF